jgi:putative MFS transporter
MAADTVMLDDVGMTPFLRKVTIFSSGGPFLDGFVLSIIGVAMDALPNHGAMRLDNTWTSIIGAAALAGIFLGTLVSGYVTDRIGRRKMFVIDIIGIAVISVATALVDSPSELFVMRFLIGVMIGADYPIATSMIAEFTPRRYRAITMGAIAAMWYVGANVAYLVGYFLTPVNDGWRWMLASSVVPCVVILVGRWNIPESPRWLARKGKADEAAAVLRRMFGTNVTLESDDREKTSYSRLFQRQYAGKVIFVGVIWLCQVVPMFALYTFGPAILNAVGIQGRGAILGNILIGTFFMAGCIPAMFWANSMGRRLLIIGSFAIMTVALAVLGIVPNAGIVVVMTCFIVYAFFSGGPGNLEWLYPTELFPTDIRASAVGVAMAISRIGTVISTYLLPGFLASYGTGRTMLAGAGISALGLVVSIAMAPETRRLGLIEASELGLRGSSQRGTRGLASHRSSSRHKVAR